MELEKLDTTFCSRPDFKDIELIVLHVIAKLLRSEDFSKYRTVFTPPNDFRAWLIAAGNEYRRLEHENS